MRVPTYVSNVNLRPSYQQGVQVRATADAFGAANGRGLQGLAQGIGQAAEASSQLAELDAINEVKGRDNKYAEWERNAMYGDGGYMTLEGENAVKSRVKFEEDAAAKRKEFGAGLTGMAAQKYDDASGARLQRIQQNTITHSAGARKQWFKDATEARLDTFAEDAVAAYKDPKAVDFNIAAGQAEIREQGAMLGWDADTLKNREAEYISTVRMNTGMRMMSDDPIAAEKYFNDHKDQFTGPHQFKFEETLKVPLVQEKVKQNTNGFFSGGSASSGGDYYAAIRSAESGGDDAAKNPKSSATGRYQFTTGTWNQLRLSNPSLGLTEFGRTDPLQQEVAIRAFTEANGKTLAARGVAVTNGSLYAAHFLGAGGAVNVLRASPDAMLTDILPTGVIEANSFLRGMNVSDFTAWANRKGGGDGAAPASLSTVEGYLSGISDPTEREMTRKSIYAQLDARDKAEKQQREAVTAQAFNMIETQNLSPFDLPPEVSTQIGMEGMSSLMTYWEKKSSGQEPETDQTLLYDMQMMYAQDPKAFAETNLLEYKNSLSKSDFEKVSNMKASALTDERKAREESLTLTSAFSQASTQLEAVGITTTGLKDKDRLEASKRVASFNNALADEMRAFQEENGKAPTQLDIQSMTNKLLLPIVLKTPGKLWGENTEEGKFLFEAGSRVDSATVDVVVSYEDIPIDLRRGISTDLEVELGRKPSKEEIISRYEEVVLSR